MFVNDKTIEIIFAQFGNRCSIVEPSYSSFRKFFPNAKFTMFCDQNIHIDGINVIIVEPPFNKSHYRYGNRSNDYYKILGLLESKSEIAICIDNDMLIVSQLVKTLINLTTTFGACIPSNPRYIVKKDTLIGEDSDKLLDETEGTAFALNMSPVSLDTKNENGRNLFSEYCNEICANPVRGPLAMWRAILKTKFYPCLLPPQWCVCQEHCGIGDEIILHVGHEKIKQFYRV